MIPETTTSQRLDSSSVVQKLDQGYESLAWQHRRTIRDLSRVNIHELLASKDPKRAIQSLPPQQVFWAIKEQGIDQCGEAIKLMSDDQLIRMLDYDAWRDTELNRTQAIAWLGSLETTGEGSVANRYRNLDEEFQIAMLQGKIRTYDEEELEQAPDHIRDNLIAMPCGELHYEVLSGDADFVLFVTRLIDSALDMDVRYAYALLNYASHSIPNEAEYQLFQFREARMQEDGFVSFQESLESFRPINFEPLKRKWSEIALEDSAQSGSFSIMNLAEGNFLDRVLSSDLATNRHADLSERVHQQLLILANGLCAAVGVEAGDSRGLIKVLEQEQSMVGLGLEFLSDGNIPLGFKILTNESAKTLFRVGITLIELIQSKVIERLKERYSGIDQIEDLHRRRKIGALLLHLDTKMLDTFGFELNEMLKGLFNRFPMRLAPIENKAGETMRYQFRPFIDIRDLNEFNDELCTAIASVNSTH